MQDVTEDFKNNLTEWVSLKKTLAKARSDLSVLTKREKELRKEVSEGMHKSSIDVVNLRQGEKVKKTERKSKGGVTKDVIRQGLEAAFPNNEAERERVRMCIEDCRQEKVTLSVSLTGLNKNKDS